MTTPATENSYRSGQEPPVGPAQQKLGYCLADLPVEIQKMAIHLDGSLGCSPAEAYAQMLEHLS